MCGVCYKACCEFAKSQTVVADTGSVLFVLSRSLAGFPNCVVTLRKDS